ncbi:hypothetical protein QBC43DRAFT_53813 [Cladorrhinum sp. PSN259]|nr:hypothetical protein QBC43DRAFT_53813 [Cladorrhinum sp. PSN259]
MSPADDELEIQAPVPTCPPVTAPQRAYVRDEDIEDRNSTGGPSREPVSLEPSLPEHRWRQDLEAAKHTNWTELSDEEVELFQVETANMSLSEISEIANLFMPVQSQGPLNKPIRVSEVQSDDLDPFRTRSELDEVLAPILERGPCILISHGSAGKPCQLIPLAIGPDATDNVAMWKRIQEEWYNRRGHWRKNRWLSRVYGVKDIHPVKVRVIGSHPSDPTSLEAILYPVDVDKETRTRKDKIGHYYEKRDPSLLCKFNPEYEGTEHGSACTRGIRENVWDLTLENVYGDPDEFDWGVCDYEQQDISKMEKEVAQLNRTRFMKHAFHRPEHARGNELIPRDHTYTKQSIRALSHKEHITSVVDLVFHGYRIEEGWLIEAGNFKPGPAHTIFTIFGLLLMVAWAFYHDWGIAWTAVGSIGTVLAVAIGVCVTL